MTPVEFLRAVWPDEGHYCIATPFTPPEGTQTFWAHRVFDTVEAAAAHAEQISSRTDVFFAVHTLAQPKVWNPTKLNRKTGEQGAYEYRTHTNMLAARAFFFDLDVGEGDGKYPTQRDALRGLMTFCATANLPKPLVVSSGGGLHAYWRITDALPSGEWKAHAAKLRQLARYYGLKADPARTTDVSSVLRVAGTFNLKKGGKRPVDVLTPSAKSTETASFIKLLDDGLIVTGVAAPTSLPVPSTAAANLLGSNLDDEINSTPVLFKALVQACPQIQRLVPLRGNVSEPEWYHSINLVRFVQNGDKFVHLMSNGHPEYDRDATDAKIEQLKGKGIKPTTCAKMAEVAGAELCESCAFKDRVRSPLVAARKKDLAPAPTVVREVDATPQQLVIPEPPHPYTRLRSGEIAVTRKNKDGDEITTTILHYDLYPVSRIVNEASESEQQMWRVHLPRCAPKDFILDADALYERRKFLTCMSHQGVYPRPGDVEQLQDFMIAYIAKLQREADAEPQCNHLGWIDDNRAFVLPDKVLMPDGTAKPASLSAQAARAAEQIKKRGTLEKQVELLKFYNHPAYAPAQFMILCSLAAPLYHATGQHGVIVNAMGEPGASKSTCLYTAASLWGDPELYAINGTNSGATPRARAERVSVLANLPICVDEITLMPPKEAQEMAMNITQPGHRLRLNRNGVERKTPDTPKSTIMLCTSNSSLHGLLSVDNIGGTAGSMRVIELVFKRQGVHTKAEADEYLHQLKQNCGHIGEAFMRHNVRHYEAAVNRVREMVRRVDADANITSDERFWSAGPGAAFASGYIAQELGLISFDLEYLYRFWLSRAMTHMRAVVKESYATPETILADYLETINENILVAHRPLQGNIANIAKMARGQLLARYDVDDGVMYILKKGFRDYCTRIGANSHQIFEELSHAKDFPSGPQRILTNRNIRKVLGAGTEQAKAQSWCIAINMKHPEVSGVVDLAVVKTPAVGATQPQRRINDDQVR
jgi:hypothetical protein